MTTPDDTTPDRPSTEQAVRDHLARHGHIDRGDLPARHVVSEQRMRQLSRRSLLTGGLALVAGGLAVRSIVSGPTDGYGGTTRALRAAYEFNEDVWSTLTDLDRTAPEFTFAQSSMPIVNGRRGIEEDIDVDAWRLQVSGPDGQVLRTMDIDEIRELPFTETIFEFKCIEGWSEITAFGGVRFSDFVAELFPGMEQHAFVGMDTPDRGYPVAMDMQAMLHPQTLLAWEMQREPLTQGHGAPLRLCTPLKYGIKNIRRPGFLQFTDDEPQDFWAERAYSDWLGL